MRRIFAPLLAAGLLFAANAHAEDTLSPLHFQSEGVLGSYDIAALQRGFLVYQTVCASCHSMNALHYRDLEALGLLTGPGRGRGCRSKTHGRFRRDAERYVQGPARISPPPLAGRCRRTSRTWSNARPKGLHYVYDLLTGYSTAPADVAMLPEPLLQHGLSRQPDRDAAAAEGQ